MTITVPATPWVLVTGNESKAREAERILSRKVIWIAVDLPEIQSNDLLEVLEAKAREAWRRLRRPLVVEETGLELSALRGFPGPLVKWMLEAVGAAGIAHTASALGDPRALARCVLHYRDDERRLLAEGACSGRLVLPPRGAGGFGWDPVFEPDGAGQTFGELSDARKDEIGHRGRAWRALVAKLG